MTDALDLAARLESAIAGLRRDDPFLPVHVLVPARLLGIGLGQAIFRETGHVAVHFERPEDLAWRLLEREALREGRRPADPLAGLAMLLAALREESRNESLDPALRAALATRGFAPAALRTLDDLERAGVRPEALEQLAPDSAAPERLRLLARLQRDLARRLDEAGRLSRAALWRHAAALPAATGLGAVVACHLPPPSPALAELLGSLARHYPFAWIEKPLSAEAAPRQAARQRGFRESAALPAPAGAATPRTALERLQAGVFSPPGGEARALDPSVRFLAASGEPLEAVEIARRIADATREGFSWGEIAVLLRGSGSRAAALDAALERAGIDAFFFEGSPRVEPAARALSLLLDLLDRDFERARVMEFATVAQVPWDDLLGPGAEASPAAWDRIATRAGIVSGLDHWRSALDRAEARSRELATRYDRDPDEERDVRLIRSLRTVLDLLARDLGALPEQAGWGEYLTATLALLDRWIRRGRAVRTRLERALRPLASHAPPPTRGEFVARVQEILASETQREGELGEPRVFVGSLANAAGLRFRLVFVPGLAERRFPGVVRPDPLLLDAERAALSPDLETTEDAREAERRLFQEAVDAATERLVLSYPRVDANGRESVPSTFLLRAAEVATGRRVGSRELLSLAEAGETLLGRAWPEDPDRAVDLLERDLSVVAGGGAGRACHLLADAPHFARARGAERAAWEPRLTPWEGTLDATDPDLAAWLERLRPGAGASASLLEDFAACPYRHLLRAGLRVRQWEEPGRGYQPDAKQRGSLYHEALERLFRALAEEGRLPLKPADLAAAQETARAIIAAVLDEAVADGVVVHRDLLGPLETDMRRDVDETLRLESEAEDGYVPTDFERFFEDVHFGYGDGREIVFRGKVDRVDVAAAPPRVRVIDWKTGMLADEPDVRFDGGRQFQLVLYNLGAQRLYPDHEVTEAAYRHSTERGAFRSKGCPNDEESRATLRTILEHLDALATGGVFPPVADSCRFCDYRDSICGPEKLREARFSRKAGDPRLRPFHKLRGIQ